MVIVFGLMFTAAKFRIWQLDALTEIRDMVSLIPVVFVSDGRP
jgi:hypothetical protein